MSPALKRLMSDLEDVKSRYAKHHGQFAVCGPHGPVGMDVVHMLVTAMAAQDEEISQLTAVLRKAGLVQTVIVNEQNTQQPKIT
jgi:hypothetical protein